MGAGPRSDHQEEGVLDFTVKPNNAGKTAKDLALAALFEGVEGGRRRC
jgi:hypothetical protein